VKILLSWLKEHVDCAVDVGMLAAALTEVGLAVDGIEKRGADAILDIDVTTNRVDCMNVRGVAREVSVIYGVPLKPLETQLEEAGPPAAEALRVTIEAPDLCPRFCARVLDVRLGPSPSWLRERLEAVGVRPISNVVDLTNYVMMELGQPTHAFDLARVPGAELCVRWAREGERLKTLDGVERTLGACIGVVAGPSEALALAGLMGGASSEVGDATRVVALEAAYWDALSIRRAARSLGMHTEASHRFERGSDPEGPVAATARLGHLLKKIGAGSVRPGLIDVHPVPRPRAKAPLRSSRLRLVLGVNVPDAKTYAILSGLGFGVGSQSVEIPTWRGDVTREIDLIEEVGRHFGVNRVPSTLPPSRRPGLLRPAQLAERRVRDVLVGAGLAEVVGYSFVSKLLEGTEGVRLANPLAEDQAVLRTSLVQPGLFEALRGNLSQGRRDVRIFELGRVFQPRPGMPHESPRLAILLAGTARPRHWSEKPRPCDFFDVRGLVELLAGTLGWDGISFEPAASLPSFLHPGRAASIHHAGVAIGWLGVVLPEFAQASELRDETVIAELSLDELIENAPKAERFQALPRQPGVVRDVSVLCERGMLARDIEAWVSSAAGPLLREVVVSDRYEGPPLPEGKLSLTLTLRYQDPERTLVSEEVQASVTDVVRALRGRGAEIRGE
jgi:phenylalanyl-tRNA synthetase beta chain